MSCFILFCIVGLGSFAFHCTLWRSFQLADELPMLLGSSVFLYVIWCMEDPPTKDYQAKRKPLQLSMIIATTIITLLCCFRIYALFLLSYGIGVVSIVLLNFQIVVRHVESRVLLMCSFCLYSGGLYLWVLDRTYCKQVQPYHFHALWHLCSGAGTYVIIIYWIVIRSKVRFSPFAKRAVVVNYFPLSYVIVVRN